MSLDFFQWNRLIFNTSHNRPAQAKKCRRCADKVARLDFIVACSLSVFSFFMGSLTGSAGLHAVALKELGDIIAKGANWLSILAAGKPPTKRFPYGYGKLQFLSSLVMGLLLSFGAVSFVFFNIQHINDNLVSPPSQLSILAAVMVGITCEIMYHIMKCTGEQNNNLAVLAAAMDNRVDAISSLAVLVGAVLANMGWFVADHIAALAVAVLVARIGGKIVMEAIHGLLDIGLRPEIISEVEACCRSVERVEGVKNIRGRRLGDSYEFDISLYVPGELTVIDSFRLKQTLSTALFSTIDHTEHVHISLYPASSKGAG
ncbi:MAG: cation transporter [Magnetococcales bacterium]|nr:cation transporter [Magnetococcales bacterium]